jgi:hypothetical protein
VVVFTGFFGLFSRGIFADKNFGLFGISEGENGFLFHNISLI